MEKLGNFVNSSIKALKAHKAVQLHQLKSSWLEVVGASMATQATPVKLQGDTLFLVVSSSLWAQEIALQQRLILKKLRDKLPQSPRRLKCWVGEVNPQQTRHSREPQEVQELVPWATLPIPASRKSRIEKSLESLPEGRSRDKLRALMELSVQRELYLIDAGQLPCPICSKFRPPERDICPPCERERNEAMERNALQLLARQPWLSAQEFLDKTPLNNNIQFLKLRKILGSNLLSQAWNRTRGMSDSEVQEILDQDLRSLFLDLTMLRCSLPAHKLTPRHFYYALGKRLAKAYLEAD